MRVMMRVRMRVRVRVRMRVRVRVRMRVKLSHCGLSAIEFHHPPSNPIPPKHSLPKHPPSEHLLTHPLTHPPPEHLLTYPLTRLGLFRGQAWP